MWANLDNGKHILSLAGVLAQLLLYGTGNPDDQHSRRSMMSVAYGNKHAETENKVITNVS